MHISIEASLKKLRTTYIDIFYVHWWDHTATVEEVMDALHNLVVAGKVLYLVSFLLSYRSFIPTYSSLITI
jgi:aryl-alcohol dehydrogenase-like predicted oxidoreductase